MKTTPQQLLRHATLYLRDQHMTCSASEIAYKDWPDYCAIRILVALEELVSYTEPI